MCGFSTQFRLLALLTVAVTVTASGLDHETMLCANDNTPSCARSRGEYLLFKNECDLRKAQRENLMGSPLFDVALYNCVPSCEFECDAAFQPICGVSVASGERKSFRNRCEMMRTSCHSKSDWLVYKWGVCPRGKKQKTKQAAHTLLVGQRKRRRPIPCTNVYRPVCASYAGVKSTFSNECLVNAENIRTRRNWRIISEGLCGEDSTKMKHNRKWKPITKPKAERDTDGRSKRSHKQLNQLEDFEISEDAVQIFAPSTFHTQFISNTGTMEKSYSLPARRPQLTPMRPKGRRIYGSNTGYGRQAQVQAERRPAGATQAKHCVFSNEPVCGSFNGESRTFPNVCALMQYSQTVGNAWTILYEGSCRRCDKPCPTVYSPICANRNGISYTIINECYLERVRCKDPNSDWKITHKGECAAPTEEVAQSIPAPNPKPSSGIPRMLYATGRQQGSIAHSISSTTTPRPRSQTRSRTPSLGNLGTTATPMPRSLLKKPKRPMPTPKDLSNRKIRKIELDTFGAYENTMYSKKQQPIKMPATSKLWSSKDSWSLDQGSYAKDGFNKRPHFKKAHSEKYPHYYWPQTLTTSTQPQLGTTAAPTTTTTSSTLGALAPFDTLDDIAEAEMLSFDIKSASQIFGEIEADTEILLMMDATSEAARAIETEATTSATTTLATTAETTEATTTTTTTTISPTSTTFTTPATTTTTTESNTSEGTTPERVAEESTSNISSSTFIDVGTSEVLDQSTTGATAAATTTTTTSSREKSTTPNLDYMSDEPLANQSEQTSIYGLDKNSLIMRLLRARSGKNMVL